MAAISLDVEQLGRYFALHIRTTHRMCLQNVIGISITMMALDSGRFEHAHTFWIQRQRLQHYETHMGLTLHVEPI